MLKSFITRSFWFVMLLTSIVNSACATQPRSTPTQLPTAIAAQAVGVTPTLTRNPTPTVTPTTTVTPTIALPSTLKTSPFPTKVPLLTFYKPDAYDDLLLMAPISQGIDGWTVWTENDKSNVGKNQVQMVADPTYKQVVEFSRIANGFENGGAGIVMPLDVDVSKYSHLYLNLTGKIVRERGSYLRATQAPYNSAPSEAALFIQLKYLNKQGKQREYSVGFWTHVDKMSSFEQARRFELGQWFNYASADLMFPIADSTVREPPQRITEIKIYGYAWEFTSQVAQIKLSGAPAVPTLLPLDIDPCALLSDDEIKTALGESIPLLTSNPSEGSCWYGSIPPGDLFFLDGLMVIVGKTNATRIADSAAWVQALAQAHRLEFAPGLGEQGFVSPNSSSPSILARQKDILLIMSATRSRVKAAQPVQALKKLAELALSRLPH